PPASMTSCPGTSPTNKSTAVRPDAYDQPLHLMFESKLFAHGNLFSQVRQNLAVFSRFDVAA
ncbi:MAG: hypothetical protein KJP02_12310, partial [Octadecabacter sp.]|nr:hypothetical protein [Octadecabacter sp.]